MGVAHILSQRAHWLPRIGGVLGLLLLATYGGKYFVHRQSLQRVQSISSDCKKAVEDHLSQTTQAFEAFFVATKSEWPQLFSQGKPSKAFLDTAQRMLAGNIQDIICVDAAGKVTYALHNSLTTTDFAQIPSFTQLLEQVAITLMPTIVPSVVLPGTSDRGVCIGFPYVDNKKYEGTIVVRVAPQKIEALVAKYAGEDAVITIAQADKERGMVLFCSQAIGNRQFLLLSRPLLRKAFSGDFGASLDVVKNEQVYNARDFSVEPCWAISTVLKRTVLLRLLTIISYFLWALVALFALSCCALMIIRISSLFPWIMRHATPLIFLFLSFGLIISTWLSCRYVERYFAQRADVYKKNIALTQYNVQYATSLMVEHNYQLQSVVHAAALDLVRNHLKLSEWKAYSDKVIATMRDSSYFVLGISYMPAASDDGAWNSQVELSAHPRGTNSGAQRVEDPILKTEYMLTRNKVVTQGPITDLKFGEDLKKLTQGSWIRRTQQPELGPSIYFIYAEPFSVPGYKGFVWGVTPYDYLVEIVKVLGNDKAAQAIAFDLNGVLLYHPNFELVKNAINIRAVAPELKPAADKALQGDAGILDLPQRKSVFIYESLPSYIGASAAKSRWSIGIMYDKAELVTSTPDMHRNMMLAVLFLIAVFLCACGLLLQIYTLEMHRWFLYGFIYCLIILSGIGTFIFLNYRYVAQESVAHAITSQIQVLKARESYEASLGRKVVPIVTTVTIQFLDIAGPNDVNFSARIEQTIDRAQFPHAQFGFKLVNKAGKMTVKELTRSRKDSKETVLYAVQGKAHQIHPHYVQAPFDVQQVTLQFAPVDQEQPAFLALDVDAYERLSPETRPGLSDIFEVNRYVIEKSCFRYHAKQRDLVFAIVLKRNLLSVLLESLLPLLVILMTIFFITIVSMFAESKRINMLAVVSGLFFSLILLHQKYRTTLAIAEVSFLEMFIVVAYLSMAYAYFDIVYLMRKAASAPYKALLYWPFIMTYLLIISVQTFLN